jgi:hypothetical protein
MKWLEEKAAGSMPNEKSSKQVYEIVKVGDVGRENVSLGEICC